MAVLFLLSVTIFNVNVINEDDGNWLNIVHNPLRDVKLVRFQNGKNVNAMNLMILFL